MKDRRDPFSFKWRRKKETPSNGGGGGGEKRHWRAEYGARQKG